jgi:ABC-type bacteriocin/lantibiotic exporter with double-glycine peptidase domain
MLIGDWNLNLRSALTIEDQHYYMYGYLIWTGATAFLAAIRTSLFAQFGGKAANTLFQRLVRSVFRSPMVFFETTPIG